MLKRKLTGLLLVVFVLALAVPAWAWTEEELRIIKERQVPYDPNYTSPGWHGETIYDDTKTGYKARDEAERKALGMTLDEYIQYKEEENARVIQAQMDFIKTYGYPVTVLVNVWGRYYVQDNREKADWYKGSDALVKFPDMQPYVDNDTGRTMIPIRFVAEKLGAEVECEMEGKDARVRITKGETGIEIRTGENKALVNGKEIYLDAPVELLNGRTVVPLRFMAEVLGCNVYWLDVFPSGEKYQKPGVTDTQRYEKVIVDDPDGGLDRAIQYMQERKQNKDGWGWKDDIYLQTLEEVKLGAKPYPVEPVRTYMTGDSPKAQPPVKAGGSKLSGVLSFIKKPAVIVSAGVLLFLIFTAWVINRRKRLREQRKKIMQLFDGPL